MTTTEITTRRVFNAPPELVFECLTNPEQLTQFWGPAGSTTPRDRITVDLRVGGTFRTTMVFDDGSEFTSNCTYTIIEPPHTLAWVEGGVTSTTTLTDLGDGRTEMVLHLVNLPAEMASPEAQAGFNSSLDRLAAHLDQ